MVKLFIYFSLVIFMACSAYRPAASKCRTKGLVKDYSYLDGCAFIIELENGDLLHPVSVPKGFELQDDQRIVFSYKVLKDMMSICMVGKAMVDITCIRIDTDKKE